MSNVRIEESWKRALANEFEQPYFQVLTTFVKKELAEGKTLYPPGPLIFNAFAQTPIDKVKVVILGQDPYHNAHQAMGLSFSVPKEVRTPPSLLNIYKEINADLGLPIATHGDLTGWAQQGVFLLNSILTVEGGNAGSHQKSGWQIFTDAVIKRLSDEREHLVFMLWGNFAKQKGALIDKSKHLILESAHPSPLAGNAFSGCRHFSKANEYLKQNGIDPIDWRII
jgi:uracil-DNA glycosylase